MILEDILPMLMVLKSFKIKYRGIHLENYLKKVITEFTQNLIKR